MATTIHVTDSSGNSISNASIDCGGCSVTNAGDGFYRVDVDVTPDGGAFVVSADGKLPTTYSWWTNLFSGGNVALQDIPEAPSKW